MTGPKRLLTLMILVGLIATACSGPPEASGPTQGGIVGDSVDEPTAVELIDRSGPFSVTVFHEQGTEAVDVNLVAPRNAAEVQVAFEPTFANAPWYPVDDIDLMTLSTGVQEFFVRYRASDGSPVGELDARALSILPALTPLTGLTANADNVRLTRVGTDVLQLDLIIGEVVFEETGQAWLAGPDLPVEQWSTENTSVVVDGSPVTVEEVGRQSWPVGNIDFDTFAIRHRIHIRLAEPIAGDGAQVDLSGFDTPVQGDVSDDAFSPAVRLSELGWGAADQKIAYVTIWSALSDQIEHVSGATARVIDIASGEEVLTATGVPFDQQNEEGELWRGDLTGGPTTSFDFSDLSAPGRYRLCVGGIGCSTPFDISVDGPWQEMTATVARALFHQRSGIALDQPYTAFARPRPYHPDDGLIVEASDQTLIADANGRALDDEPFADLIALRTGETVDDAWGGHFDAGDWDRRIQHLWFARRLIDLVELFPDTTGALELNIPESGDEVPDLLDEARWTIDLFARLQLDNGAVRGGIEAADHPTDHTSWTEDLDVFAYAPDAWSSSIYAGVVADLAFVLEPYDSDAAARYLESAERAQNWAEANLDTVPSGDEDVDVQRAIAAVSLYRATGDEAWHDLFLELTPLTDGIDREPCVLASSCESSWRYATLPAELGRDEVRANASESIVDVADQLLVVADTTAFGWAPEAPNIQLIWSNGPSTPHSVTIIRAFLLTGDQAYRDLAVRNASFALGGNPSGVTYLTGVGTENPRQPLLVDQRNSDLPIWPGIPIYGVFTAWQLPEWYQNLFLRDAGTTPDPAGWPTLHSFFDQGVFAGQSEFTVQQSHGEAIWSFGALHGTVGFTSEDTLVAE